MTKSALLAPGRSYVPPSARVAYARSRNIADASPIALPPRKLLPRHDGLPFSAALQLVRLLDEIEIRHCDHCADLRYALVDYVRGMVPLERRYTPDVVYDVVVNGAAEVHIRPGLPV